MPSETRSLARPASAETAPPCRYCGAALTITWLDLGEQPLANSYAASQAEARALPRYPLHARACPSCWLVQVDDVVPTHEIFSDYAYFSSYSDSWLDHCRRYTETMIDRFGLGGDQLVIEVASNDGYLLKQFAERGVNVLGIDPAANVAEVARAAGVPTEVDFFGVDLARRLVARGIRADHLAAKNVLAHVPDIGDFAGGVATLLAPDAVFTVEFPHLLRTMRQMQFDQIYHEHYTYLSLLAIERVMGDHGLRVFDVEEVPTHGGSLRVFVCHEGAAHHVAPAVARVRADEIAAELDRPEGYAGYGDRVAVLRRDFLQFLDVARREGKTVAAYGAAAKGNTFLNYCEVGPDLPSCIADRSPAKAGRFAPGSGIAIVTPEDMLARRPDYLLILPWNLRDEVSEQMAVIREWGGRFVTAVPELRVF